uniref:CCHC-type domain-containing protein n=1 Tax=Ananas comosus var. bracteatus TaxID=296719 RepID=A0A6V7QUE7_ANACO
MVLGKTAAPCPRQLGDPLRRSIERTGAVNVISSGLSIDLERRFQELKHHLGNGVMATTHPSSSSINDRSLAKKVIWADSAGLDLAQVTFFSKDDSPTAPAPSAPAPAVKDTDGKGAPADRPWTEVHYKRNGRLAPPGKPSYKEALLYAAPPSSSRNPPSPLRNALSRNPPPPPLRFAPAHRSRASLPSRHPPPPLRNILRNTPPKRSFKDRCFRCLGRNHRAAACREPLRCALCLKTGHKARSCMDRLPMDVYRYMRARPAYLNVFVPQTEDFFARQNRRRNALLVDVVPAANLGHFAQDTIANGLANRFGGFPTDFLVARYRDREFVVFLPEWVPSESLVRRVNLSLGDIRLRYYAWNPYSGARRFSPPYKAWIRLVSLPYECWSSRTVAAIVGGFARFIRADEHTTRMIDHSGYRCLVAVNHLHDIPENLEVAFGDVSLSVLIQLERWARDDDNGRGDPPPPPNERTDHFDPDMRSLEVERRSEALPTTFTGPHRPLELGSVPVTEASPTSLGSGSAPVAEASLVFTGSGPAGTPVGDASADSPVGDASADRIPYPKGQICLFPNLSSSVQVDLPVGESTGLPADHASFLSHPTQPRSPSACCWKTSPSGQAGISFCTSLVYREKSLRINSAWSLSPSGPVLYCCVSNFKLRYLGLCPMGLPWTLLFAALLSGPHIYPPLGPGSFSWTSDSFCWTLESQRTARAHLFSLGSHLLDSTGWSTLGLALESPGSQLLDSTGGPNMGLALESPGSAFSAPPVGPSPYASPSPPVGPGSPPAGPGSPAGPSSPVGLCSPAGLRPPAGSSSPTAGPSPPAGPSPRAGSSSPAGLCPPSRSPPGSPSLPRRALPPRGSETTCCLPPCLSPVAQPWAPPVLPACSPLHSAEPSPSQLTGGAPTPLRVSARLSNLTDVNVLGRAMNRKAILLEGSSSDPGPSARNLSRSRIKKKSLLLGVAISDAEAKDLQNFLSVGV